MKSDLVEYEELWFYATDVLGLEANSIDGFMAKVMLHVYELGKAYYSIEDITAEKYGEEAFAICNGYMKENNYKQITIIN